MRDKNESPVPVRLGLPLSPPSASRPEVYAPLLDVGEAAVATAIRPNSTCTGGGARRAAGIAV
jgi:hypothetical protein